MRDYLKRLDRLEAGSDRGGERTAEVAALIRQRVADLLGPNVKPIGPGVDPRVDALLAAIRAKIAQA